MSERDVLLASVADTIQDYRSNENVIQKPMVEHVKEWIGRFENSVRLPILREINFVLKKTYYSKQRVKQHLNGVIDLDFIPSAKRQGTGQVCSFDIPKELVKPTPHEFWPTATVLDIQRRGSSQTELKFLFGDLLREKLKLCVDECGMRGGPYIYLDDFLFSGNRIKYDILHWIEKIPVGATVYIIVMASHSNGEYYLTQNDKGLMKKMLENGRGDISLHLWGRDCYKNQPSEKDNSDVLWPTSSTETPELKAYVSEDKRQFRPRDSHGGRGGNFFSNESRTILEKEMLSKGHEILKRFNRKNKPWWRPLGWNNFGYGFGSMLATYRNCPNTAPLALWWKSEEWEPLLLRRTNDRTDIDAYEKDFDDIFCD